LHITPDRIEKTIVLHSSLSRVWRALSDSREFGKWFGVKFDAPFVPGVFVRGVVVGTAVDAEVAKAQQGYKGLPFEITIEAMERERLFSFRWHPFAVDIKVDYSNEPTTLVEFKLETVSEGVLLTITESGFDKIPLERRAQAFTSNEQGWAMMGKVIEEYLAQTP